MTTVEVMSVYGWWLWLILKPFLEISLYEGVFFVVPKGYLLKSPTFCGTFVYLDVPGS